MLLLVDHQRDLDVRRSCRRSSLSQRRVRIAVVDGHQLGEHYVVPAPEVPLGHLTAVPAGDRQRSEEVLVPPTDQPRDHVEVEHQCSGMIVDEFDRMPRSGETVYRFAVGIYSTDHPTQPTSE